MATGEGNRHPVSALGEEERRISVEAVKAQ
jgi:hypothetical protein